MPLYEPKVANSQSTTEPVEVTFTAPQPFSSICAEAIDANDAPVALANVTGGVAVVTVKTSVHSRYETLYAQDGTTPVQIDLTAPETKIAPDVPIVGVKITLSSAAAGTGVTGVRLSVDQYN